MRRANPPTGQFTLDREAVARIAEEGASLAQAAREGRAGALRAIGSWAGQVAEVAWQAAYHLRREGELSRDVFVSSAAEEAAEAIRVRVAAPMLRGAVAAYDGVAPHELAPLEDPVSPLSKDLRLLAPMQLGTYVLRPTRVIVPKFERAVIGGVAVSVGSAPGVVMRVGAAVREGFALFRRGAAARAPWMLGPGSAPIELVPYAASLRAAYVHYDASVRLYLASRGNDAPQRVAHVLAHEQGHHAWRTRLTADGQAAWSRLVRERKVPLDADAVLDAWPDEVRYLPFSSAAERIAWEVSGRGGPLPYQIVIAASMREVRDLDLRGFAAWVFQGGSVLVPEKPVTVYGHTSAEEAFCDAAALLVASGPRAVDPEALDLLRELEPRTRVSNPGPRSSSAKSKVSVVQRATVEHVGRIDGARVGSRLNISAGSPAHSSHEGVGLSVSLHPHAWASIAKLGARAVTLVRSDGAPGNFALHSRSLVRLASAWAVANGWAENGKAWRAIYWDREDDAPRWLLCRTRAEAESEVEGYDDEDEDQDRRPRVEEVSVLLATPRMTRRWLEYFRGASATYGLAPEDVETESVNLWVAAERPDLDGVWWSERFDPSALSAPRGVILPHASERWVVARAYDLRREPERVQNPRGLRRAGVGSAEGPTDLSSDAAWHDVFYRDPDESRVRDLDAFLRSDRGRVLRLYHGTWEGHPIARDGLLPTTAKRARSLQSGHGFVYLSVYPGMARTFGEMAYPRQKVVVYAVDVPVSALRPDADQLKNRRMWDPDRASRYGAGLADSLAYGHGARVRGRVDQARISVVG